ncbi:unnamed protein product, partial [Rotaria sp. Silwood1]
MTDTQPLISGVGRYSTDDSNKNRRRLLINKLFNWFQCFAFKQLNKQYETLDVNNDDTKPEPVIGYFEL